MYPLPQYADSSIDEIRASHVLEHFTFSDGVLVLAEWFRVLKPGGRIRVAVPDLDKALLLDEPHRSFVIMGGQTDENDIHKASYTTMRLAQVLSDAGFVGMCAFAPDGIDTADHVCSLNIEAIKPIIGTPKQVKISALMSVPRVGWNDSETCITRALSNFGIPTNRVTGVFWGQCMQRGMEMAAAKGVDWILCLDYDSMITVRALQQLIDDFSGTPDADAICALQRRRQGEHPLLTKADADGKIEIDGSPVQINTGHFGFTLLKVESIKKMPKPWFNSTANMDGEWGEGRLDDDIWFWKQWQGAGNKLYLSPLCSIGHLELMVSEFDEDMQPRHVHITDWRQREGLM